MTAVVTFTLYVVESSCPLVRNIAWLPEQVDSNQPGLSDVTFVVLTVKQSIFSSQLMVTELLIVIPVAPSAGIVELTEGAVWSIVTDMPADGIS
jgi:hypothetical protein